MKIKEKKTLAYALLSIAVIVVLSMYLGKTDYSELNKQTKAGLVTAKDNAMQIADKLKAYIDYEDSDENITDIVTLNKAKSAKLNKNLKVTLAAVSESKKESKKATKVKKKDVKVIKKPIIKKEVKKVTFGAPVLQTDDDSEEEEQ